MKNKINLLKNRPQMRGIIQKLIIVNPKKPNSGNRKAAVIYLPSKKKTVNVYIPGIRHNLKIHNEVLIEGGKTKDLVGFRFKVVKGALDYSVNKTKSKK